MGVWLYVCMCASIDLGGHSCVIEFSLYTSACGMIKLRKQGCSQGRGSERRVLKRIRETNKGLRFRVPKCCLPFAWFRSHQLLLPH